MSILHKLSRNVRTLVSNPEMAVAYARWTCGRLVGGVVATSHYGARIAGFENFSNYWGTICKIPPASQFQFVAACLKGSAPVCFDVGANIGSFSVILGKHLPTCQIHAFEPAPNTFAILRANIARNQLAHVQAHQLAVSEAAGTVRFSNDPSISQRNRIVTAGEDRASGCEVPATSLDDFCRARGIGEIGFVKVDCEGVEPLVLRGAVGLLRDKRIKALLVEVCPRNLRAFGFTIQDLLSAVRDVPYVFHRVSEADGVGVALTDAQLSAIESEDVLLLPR